MMKLLLSAFISLLLFVIPFSSSGQAPDLGTASSFAVFTAVGAFSNDGATVVTGDVGTNAGAFTGFPPGVVIGNIHVADAISATAAVDVAEAYAELAGLTCGQVIGVTLGNNQILTPDIYCTGAATTLNGNLTLDAEGDPNAIFIFQIGGALSTTTLSSITLINGASLCNVYWQINGAVELGVNSMFLGTILANGALSFLEGATLLGRALSQAGAVDMHNNIVTIGLPPVASVITAEGATTFCAGDSVILSGNIDGTWNNGSTAASITVTMAGDYYVVNTTICGSDTSNHIIITINPLPLCTITGDLDICEGESTQLCASASASTFIWNTGATTSCISVMEEGIYSVTITDSNGCTSNCSVTVNVNPAPVCTISGETSICVGESTALCAPTGASDYVWSTGAITDCITVTAEGIYTVTVTDANGCTSSCSVTVTVNPEPVCTITGNNFICEGGSTILCAPAGAATYLWNTGAITDCITITAEGLYTVTVTDANGCSSICSVTVTVNPEPVCTITGNNFICEGGSTILCAPAGAATYLWNTGAITDCITVTAEGLYTVTITDANGCSSSCSETVTVTLQPSCTITGDTSICEGETTQLCTPPGAESYLWSTGAITNCITADEGGLYSVTITYTGGCTSTCEITLNINPLPICTISGEAIICEGASTDLCASPGAASYLWNTGDTTDCITVTAEGLYTVTITDANGCSSSCSVTVTVNPAPVCTITGNNFICEDGSTILCAPPGAASYLWNTGDITDCITVNAEGLYTVTVTDANGCSSSCSQTVTVTEPPVCIISGETEICEGESTLLCAPAGAANYLWNTGSIESCISTTEPGMYSVTVTESNGCSSICSVNVLVNPLPDCTITGENIICEGESTILCAPSGAAEYLWNTGDITNCITVNAGGQYTVTVTDVNGCSSICNETVTVSPGGSLSITCPADIMIECDVNPEPLNTGTAVAIGNCNAPVTVIYTDTTLAGQCPQEYTIIRTWVATDSNGNSVSCNQTITIEDSLAPIVNCPANVTVDCAENVPQPDITSVTSSDNCGGTPLVVFVGDIISNQVCDNQFVITRTYRVTDGCGNSAECSQLITVLDNTLPSIICPANVTVDCAENVPQPDITSVISSDNCGGIPLVVFVGDIISNQVCDNQFVITRIYRVTDDCGNSNECSQLITVFDNTLPSIICPANVTVDCAVNVPQPDITSVISSDNCGGLPLVVFVGDIISNQVCDNQFVITRTFRVTDDCGNSSECSQLITVFDNTLPSIICPANVTVDCAGDVPPVNISLVVASDNCGSVLITHEDDIISDQICPNNFILTRIFQVIDDCGNLATCAQVITVNDNIPPEITLVNPILEPEGDTTFVQCFGQDPEWDLPQFDENSVSVSDNCGENITVTFNQALISEGDCSVDGFINLYSLVWTAIDECGNTNSVSVLLALVDTIPPVIFGVPGDTTVNCDDIPELPLLVYAIDECLCACVILVEESMILDGCQDGQVLVRTWTAKDRCGNETILTQRITLIDNQGPTLQILQPELNDITGDTILSYTCNDGGIPAFFDGLNASSAIALASCGASTITFDSEIIRTANCEFFGYMEQHTFTWTALDECGNESSLSINVRLIDNEAPVFIGLRDLVCIGDPSLSEVEAIDNCGNPSIRFWDVEIPNPCGVGVAVRRTYEAFDECGNITRDTTILIPNEQNQPVIQMMNPLMSTMSPDNHLTLNCAANGSRYTNFSADDIAFLGMCGQGLDVSFSENLISLGDCNVDGIVATVELKWVASDLCGNESELLIIADIIDESGPVFHNFSPAMTIGCGDAMPEILTSDNCGDAIVTIIDSIIPGDCAFEYIILRAISATDPCGNTTKKIQTIRVGDGSGPVITGVDEKICDDLTLPEVTAFDACSGQFVEVSMHQDTLDMPCLDGLVIERIWTAVNICGNVTEIHQTIILNDQEPPEIMIPSWSVIRLFMDNDHNLIFLSQKEIFQRLNDLNKNSVFVEDDCDQEIEPVFNVVVSYPDDCELDGYYERRTYTWFIKDACDNTDSLSFTVDIMDDVPPVFTNEPNDTLLICVPLPFIPFVDAQDSTSVTIVFSEIIEESDQPGVFIVKRTWIATDACGNSSENTQVITWQPDSFLECDIMAPPTVECNSHGVIIGSLIVGGNGPINYQWEIVGEKCFIQGGQGTPEIIIYTGWSQIKIILTVTDAFGCVSMCMMFLDCEEGAASFEMLPVLVTPEANEPLLSFEDSNQLEFVTHLQLWPNPAQNVVHINFESSMVQQVDIVMISFLGQEIHRESFTTQIGSVEQEVNLNNIPEGNYLLQIRTSEGILTTMLSIVRSD